MAGRMEILRWIQTNAPTYAATWLHKGQFIAAGTEKGAVLFDLTGRRLLSYPPTDVPVPVHQLAASDVPRGQRDNNGSPVPLGTLFVGTRQGWVVRLSLTRKKEKSEFEVPEVRKLYQATNDLHTLSLAADANLLAVGHLAPGLAVLDTNGKIIWRRHPDDDNATNGRVWTVALDSTGDVLYVGSAGAETNVLAALDAQAGDTLAYRHYSDGERVTGLTVLPKGRGVAAIIAEDMYSSRLEIYPRSLDAPLWERAFYEQVTALAADVKRPLLALSVGYEGQVTLMNPLTGEELAHVSLRALANDLAITNGQMLAAATDDGHLALIRYLPEEFSI